MDESSPFRKKWLYIVAWLALLLVFYGWQIARLGGIEASIPYLFLDLACIFPVLLILWMAFFAQFVLPVYTFTDRQKIFSRLLTDLFGGHGPALFIENGEIKEHSGERLKKGPGVVWLDSASAAVTRTAVKLRQTIGPGVHFIESREFIAGTVDLHIQSQTLGPKEFDKPFDEKKEGQSDEEWNQIQDRRKQVSALTRDGIEVIPNISVTFRVNTGFPREGQPGSRFGYRTGISKKDRENERKDQDAIRKAILGEGVNPNVVPDSPRHRVKWNELPAALAVDLWREYAAKFTLDELFKPGHIVPPAPLEFPRPTEEEIDPLSQPLQVSASRNNFQDSLASMLRETNLLMSRAINWLEGKKEDKTKKPSMLQPPSREANQRKSEMKTALQFINEMVKERLTKNKVDFLDDHGRREYPDIYGPPNAQIPSHEFELLEDRGLIVLSVSINSVRFDPVIEETIIRRWSTTWLSNAKAESEQIERRRNIIESAGQEKAMRQYADLLSSDLVRKKPVGAKETLKTLLMRTRTIIIKNDQLRKRMGDEQQELENIIRWIEVNGS